LRAAWLWALAPGGRYRNERERARAAKAIDWQRLFRADRTIPASNVTGHARRRSRACECAATLTESRTPCATASAPTPARGRSGPTSARPTFALSGVPHRRRRRRSTSTPPASRCSSAAAPRHRTRHRCARPRRGTDRALKRGGARRAAARPMCGSGTIAIEAALSRRGPRAGARAHVRLPEARLVRRPTWQRIRQKRWNRVAPPPASPVVFRERRRGGRGREVRGQRRSAKVDAFLAVDCTPTCSRGCAPAPAGGPRRANPPYGARLSDRERLAAFYPLLGDALKRHFAGWTAWLLSGDPRAREAHRAARRAPHPALQRRRSSAGSTASRW